MSASMRYTELFQSAIVLLIHDGFCFYEGGMQAIFEIRKCFPNVHKPRPHGQLREFFIAAEEEVWDYAPTLPTDRFLKTHAHKHMYMHGLTTHAWEN